MKNNDKRKVFTRVKSRKKNIDVYKVNDKYFDVFIESIDMNTGIIKECKITHYTVHKNLEAYELFVEHIMSEPILISNDHSLIVYDLSTDKLIRIPPCQLKSKSTYYLLFNKKDIPQDNIPYLLLKESNDIYKQYFYYPVLNNLKYQDILLVNAQSNCVKLKKIEDRKFELYDLSVEETNTFKTADGLYIYDTMAQYFIQLDESIKEFEQKKIDSRLNLKYLRDDKFIHNIKHEYLFALYLLSINPREFENSIFKPFFESNNIIELDSDDLSSIEINKSKLTSDPLYLFTPVYHKPSNKYYTLGYIILNKKLFDNKFILKEHNIDKKKVDLVNQVIYNYVISKYNDLSDIEIGEKYLDLLHVLYILLVSIVNWNKYFTPRITPNDYKIYEEIIDITSKLPDEPILGSYILDKLSDHIIKKMYEQMKNLDDIELAINMLYIMYKSGARASLTQIEQLILSKGYFADAYNKVILQPVRNNLINGLTIDEIFLASMGTRKSEIDKMSYTKRSGYIQRIGLFELSIIQFDENVDDCGTHLTFDIEVKNENHARSLIGRYYLNSKNQLIKITEDN